MAEGYGAQCGYCTPGFICSLFEGYYRDDLHTHDDLDDQLSGNLCRCTGYRPIRDAAMEAFACRSEVTSSTTENGDRRLSHDTPEKIRRQTRRGGIRIRRRKILSPDFARGIVPAAKGKSRRAADRRRDGTWPRNHQALQKIFHAHLHRSRRGVDGDQIHGDRMAHRRRGHADRHQGQAGRGISDAQRHAARVRLAADPQPRHDGRQHRHRLAHRRQRAVSARAGCESRARVGRRANARCPIGEFFSRIARPRCNRTKF